MAEVARPARMPTLGSLVLGHEHRQSGLACGEDLAAGALVYVNPADGKVYNANGTAANAAARVRGVASTQCRVAQRDAVTVMHGCEIAWPTTIPPGTDLYLSAAVPGGFSTTATTGGVNPVGYVKDANHIFVFAAH